MTTQAVLKFSRTAPTEQQFRRILEASPAGVTAELAAAAMDLLRVEERKIRFSQPKLDFVEKFTMLADAFPAAMQTVIRASAIGPNGGGVVDAADVSDEYIAEEI
jgi:hypothetical protein